MTNQHSHLSRRAFLSYTSAAAAAVSLPRKAVAAPIPSAITASSAASPAIKFLPYWVQMNGRENVYAVYELLQDGVIRVSEDRHPPGEITSFWSHGLGGLFDLQGCVENGLYFDIPPAHDLYQEIRLVIADGERMRMETEQARIENDFSNAGFPCGRQQAIDMIITRHHKKFCKAAKVITDTIWCLSDGEYVDASFEDEKAYKWEYSGIRLRSHSSVDISINVVLDDKKLSALANYFEAHGTEAEKQALVIKPVQKHPSRRQRFAPPPTRASIGEQLLIGRAGKDVENDADYARFDKIVQDLMRRALLSEGA